jgi:hypothetical protein
LENATPEAYRLLKKIRDARLDVDRLHDYSLWMQCGLRDFQILVADDDENRVLLLEDYVFEHETSGMPLPSLMQLIDDHELLGARFWKNIAFIWKNRKFSFVPDDLYRRESIPGYLRANASYDPASDALFTLHHQNSGFFNVFAGERALVEYINRHYQGRPVRYLHQSSTLIEGLMQGSSGEETLVNLFIDRFGLHIAVVANYAFRFYNQYPIRSFDDYFRYLRMVAVELGLDLGLTPVNLYGYMGENTPHFSALKKTIHQLTTGRRPAGLRFSYEFDELSEHQYFDLFSSMLTRTHP